MHDFQKGADEIDLSAVDANTTVSGNLTFAFIGEMGFLVLVEPRWNVAQSSRAFNL